MANPVVGRFAPTPSGRMHLGNLLCAMLAWLSARSQGGQFLLRVEDLDTARSPRKFAERLEADLRFLGFDWDEGGSQGGPHAPYYQSERTAFYQELLDKLQSRGLVYPCFCTRAQLHAATAPHASDGEVVYDGRCRLLSAEATKEQMKTRTPALRLRMPDETISFTDGHYGPCRQRLADECGDIILRRADGVFAYQLAVVADDAAMGVTQVVRGRDLLFSTPRQLYLFRLLGLRPPAYFHLPLLLTSDGKRLSKRDRDLDLDTLRTWGYDAEDIVGRLAYVAGLQPQPRAMTLRDALPLFSWDKVPLDDIRLPEKLFQYGKGA